MTAAPIEPSALGVPTRRSTWPTVIGVIAIVFGSLALIQNAICTPAGLLVSQGMSGMMEGLADSNPGAGMEVQVAQLEAIRQYVPHSLVTALASAAVAVVLLVGGVQLVKRKYKSRTTISAWAVLKMIVALPVAYVSYLNSRAQFEAMAAAAAEQSGGPGQVPPGFFSILEGMGGAGAVLTLLWMWVLPIFMLIWFARRPIQDEIRTWLAPAPAAFQSPTG